MAAAVAHNASATPAQEIARAVDADGSNDPARAPAGRFVAGFTSIIARLKRHEVAVYFTSALQLRRDVAAPLAAATLRMQLLKCRGEENQIHQEVSRIVHTAVAANPQDAANIVAACIESAPSLSDLIVAAALTAAPESRDSIARALDAYELLGNGIFDAVNMRSGEPLHVDPERFRRRHPPVSPERPPDR